MKKNIFLLILVMCSVVLLTSCQECSASPRQTTVSDGEDSFYAVNIQTDSPYEVDATKVKEGEHCILYLEDDNKDLISEEKIDLIVNTFDNTIYHIVRENYGEESDIDGNGKIVLFGLDIVDGGSTDTGFVAGYFTSYDLMDEPFSNKKDMVYLDIIEGLSSGDIENLFATIAHEFAHLISFNERTLKREFGPLEVWLEEGIAQGAEHLYKKNWLTNAALGFSHSLDILQGTRFLAWGEDTRNSGSYSSLVNNYNAVYLFTQWLRTLTDNSFQHGMYSYIITNSYSNYQVIEEIAQKYSSKHYNSSTSWEEIFRDWNISCYMNSFINSSGLKYRYYDSLLSSSLRTLKFTPPQFWHNNSLPTLYPGEAVMISTLGIDGAFPALSPNTISRQRIRHAGIIINEEVTNVLKSTSSSPAFTFIGTPSGSFSGSEDIVLQGTGNSFTHTNRLLLAYNPYPSHDLSKSERLLLNVSAPSKSSDDAILDDTDDEDEKRGIFSKVSSHRKLYPACALHCSLH